MPEYKRPPITEAVIEVRFEKKLDRSLVDKAFAKLKGDYPFTEHINVTDVEFNQQGAMLSATLIPSVLGHKYSSLDRTDVLQITTNFVSSSRMPPYSGWESFFGRAQENWTTWKRIGGYHKVKRIGVRFINRLDIPATPGGEGIRVEDYLRVFTHCPDTVFESTRAFTLQMQGALGSPNDGFGLTINSSLVPSPLVNHVSVVFDIDIWTSDKIPQSDEELWERIGQIRAHKNRVFEASVTDKARDLFDT